jgi:hypothetical protein
VLIDPSEENDESTDDSDDSPISGDDDAHDHQSDASEGSESGADGARKCAQSSNTWRVFIAGPELATQFDEMDHYLALKNQRHGEGVAYYMSPTNTFQQVKDFVSSLGSIENLGLDNVPLNYEHRITKKYWGAIRRMLRNEEIPQDPVRFHEAVRNVRRISRIVRHFQDLFSDHTPADNQINVSEFSRAWILGLMYFILYPTEQARRSTNYLLRCEALLREGKTKVLRRLQIVSLDDREAASPLGISSILISGLLRDPRARKTPSDGHGLAALYWKDIQQLVGYTK